MLASAISMSIFSPTIQPQVMREKMKDKSTCHLNTIEGWNDDIFRTCFKTCHAEKCNEEEIQKT